MRNDNRHRAIIKRNYMFVVGRLGDGLREPFRGTTAYDIMNAFGESPPLPCGEQPGQSVREPVFESGDDDASGRARHALHVPEDDGTRPAVGGCADHRDGAWREQGIQFPRGFFHGRLLCPAVRGVPCGVLVWDTGCFFVVHYMN